MPARFGVQLPQTNVSWPEYLALWRELDDSPFESAWTMDRFLEAGFDDFIVSPFARPRIETMRRFVREVIPAFR